MRSEMEQDILKVLVSEEELKARVDEMGAELYDKFQGKNPIFLGVLKGSVMFMADLMRACQLQSDIEFIAVSSYANATESSGRVHINYDLQKDITGRHIIVVEDIVDSGRTLSYLMEMLRDRGPASLQLCTLLDKPDRRVIPVEVNYTGFTIPDEFDRIYTGYNNIQKEQGLDLSKYRKKELTRYTFEVTNYNGYDGKVYANVLVYRNKVVGGDICSADITGFVHGFEKG